MSQTQEEKHIAVLTERSRMQDALSAVDSLLTQVRQMRGMFDDKDGAIEAAVQAGEDVLNLTVPAKPITTQSKTWTPADCPNFTQLKAVAVALEEAHRFVHLGDRPFKAVNCHECAVLDAAKAQIAKHEAKVARHQPEATRPTITEEEWKDIGAAIRLKLKSPVVSGGDHESRTWRSHLATILEEIGSHEYDFNNEDWVEIYYSVVDSDANQNIVAKIGPDACNMTTR